MDSVELEVGKYHSFVVRIWSRDGDVVQGQVTHVASRECLRFRDPERLIDFVLAHLKPADIPALGERTPEESA